MLTRACSEPRIFWGPCGTVRTCQACQCQQQKGQMLGMGWRQPRRRSRHGPGRALGHVAGEGGRLGLTRAWGHMTRGPPRASPIDHNQACYELINYNPPPPAQPLGPGPHPVRQGGDPSLSAGKAWGPDARVHRLSTHQDPKVPDWTLLWGAVHRAGDPGSGPYVSLLVPQTPLPSQSQKEPRCPGNFNPSCPGCWSVCVGSPCLVPNPIPCPPLRCLIPLGAWGGKQSCLGG